ncbi:uncharacterized protein A1O9_07112 [Exophiala aquamarina CBS 119918]|uniref:BD-FAE-like domain-containing protein n=1 Tax=Exophiala aquamarina CBS 119918 TaxID=1182545 RepID=A0A072PAY5_9EURO|nr:uncharacterized protein A1O9_07112 [Exophiala aquamarina CBS 119918]KEF56922.1 hypothetical protein A1O9_07112 [Exophiala aquamarina CBS 119918]
METAENEQREPILIFIHGGGFTHGGRREPLIADDVVYRGLGYFGARELGYTTVVMDYRLLQHGASFDSGGEDLDLVIKWIESSLCGSDDNDDNARDLVIIGNSAGGVHLMSWPFDDAFTATRSRLMHAGAHLRLKTAVILSATMLLDPTISAMQDSLLRYFGDEQRVILNSPLNLMNLAAVCGNDGGPVVGGVPLTSWPPLLFHHNRVRPSICGRHGSKIRKGMG